MGEQYIVRVYEDEQDFYGPFDSIQEAENWIGQERDDLIAEDERAEVIVLNLP